jgi:hypothetical protein
MKTFENDIDSYTSLQPRRYPLVDGLLIEQAYSPEGEGASVSIAICLSSNVSREGMKLKLIFDDVVDLHLNPGSFPLTLPLLEISNIKSYQWEGIHYKVSETEEDKISFYCKSFSVTVREE